MGLGFTGQTGGMRETPRTPSHQDAADSSDASANGAATSWMPNGRPDVERPEGIEIAGRPAVVQGAWKEASPVVVRSRGEGVGVDHLSFSCACTQN